MDYFRRIFSGGIQESLAGPSQTRPPANSHQPGRPGTSPQAPTVKFDTPLHPRHQSKYHPKKHRRSRTMSFDFKGPVCKNLLEFMKNVEDIPSQHKTTFDTISKDTIETVCDADALHVWESDSDMDNLLQLTQVIIKLRNLASATAKDGRKPRDPAMIILASEKKDRNNYARITSLVQHLTGHSGQKHFDGAITAFNAIIVVRGVDNKDESATVKRVNRAIERVFSLTRPKHKKLIWHHGPILSLLLTWINTTTPTLRSTLTAISITAALDLTTGVHPSALAGKQNTLNDLTRLEDYATTLKIPVLFLDPGCGLIGWDNLARYMYYWVYYINVFFPPQLSLPHHHQALDALVTFAFRIRGASRGIYGADVVRDVQSRLDVSIARSWARTCIQASSYTKALCRDAGSEAQLQHAFSLADCPYAPFKQITGYNFPAFSRLPICPSSPASTASQYYLAAPVSFAFNASTFRPSTHSPFRVLMPKPGQSIDIVTERVQGVMMAVLTGVMKEKGLKTVPGVGREMRKVWSEVTKVCCGALEGCRGKCPEGVEGKVGCVVERLKGGGYAAVVQGEEKGKVGNGGGGWSGGNAGWS